MTSVCKVNTQARYNAEQYRLEQAALERRRADDYRKKIEDIAVERIQQRRRLRIDEDKGRVIDVMC